MIEMRRMKRRRRNFRSAIGGAVELRRRRMKKKDNDKRCLGVVLVRPSKLFAFLVYEPT